MTTSLSALDVSRQIKERLPDAAIEAADDAVLVDGVQAVTSFTYDAGTPGSTGVLRIDLALSDGDETIRLYHEIQVRNTP